MLFSVAGHEVKAEIEKKHTFKSKHSENSLEHLKIHFQVYNRTKVPKIIYSVDDGRKWAVLNSSYYYTEGNPVVRYIFDIEEIEDLNIKSLLINKLKITPYEYEEEIDSSKGDILIIKTQLEINLENWAVLKKLYHENQFLSVKRHGISPKRKKMRFGKLIWSKFNENQIKCAISLYEYNSSQFRESNQLKPEMDNLQKITAYNSDITHNLLNLLKEKKILDDEDLQKITPHKTPDIIKFGEVEDLDEFMKIYKL
ncbi:hypothetical protein [Methanobacterium alcaliphilum]|uniref:hypothetical protein n=1 Tax=Methanobacterium alcaliphilum TaxID=392018 RepID=UPI00200AABCA|nr:hypothetical protein [Methanobacterium alcaliphilum]MCK9151215.1 hypothetical protein [Methanobacterium alcaliphilum]